MKNLNNDHVQRHKQAFHRRGDRYDEKAHEKGTQGQKETP